MKKISIILLSLMALFTACDMDKYPYDANEESKAIQSVSDCESYRNGLYINFRPLFSGAYLLYPELQADYFHAVYGFSGAGVNMYMWDLNSSDGVFASFWSGYYGIIASSNYLIQETEKLLNTGDFTDAEKAKISLFQGEAYFMRAFSYNELALKFCNDYEPSTAASEWGVPLVTEYAPTSEPGKYPGRSTLEATFKRITDDLKEAENRITTKGKKLSTYVTSDIVKGLKARVALEMHNWDTAITESTSLINGGGYPLIDVNVGGVDAFKSMWANDEGAEIMWQISCSNDQRATSTITYFLGIVEGKLDFIPASGVLKLFDQENDMRFATYFAYKPIQTSAGNSQVYVFNKYPGNKKYDTGMREQLFNCPKVMRVAEMYLIAAEAYAQKGGNDDKASELLNDLKEARIADWTRTSYVGATLMKEVRNERFKEFICEGNRLNDLKRWHLGVVRSTAQNSGITYLPGNSATEALNKDATDYRMTWAIPQSELETNPQLRGQQNNGY